MDSSFFFNGLFNGFANDDYAQIINNPIIRSIQNLPTFFSGSTFYNWGAQNLGGYYYKPLMVTFFSSIYSVFNNSASAFHFFQIILCTINACILFLVLKRFFNKSLAFVLSIIFLVHPINSEAALYISAAQEVLFFFFGIISLWILQNYKSQKALIFSGVFLLCSLLSKETGILFIFVSLLYLLIYNRKLFYPFLGYSISVLAIYIVLRIHAIGVFAYSALNVPIGKLTTLNRFLNIPEIFLFYLKTFLFPLNLASSYQWVYRQIDVSHFLLPLIMDFTFLVVVCFIAVILYKKFARKYLTLYIFFSVWFLLGILFHSQIFPLDQTVAERWFYFPIVGLLGMIGVLLEVFHVNLKNKWVLLVVVFIVALLSFRTIIRSFDWRDYFTIAAHDIKVSKDAYDMEGNLSYVYLQQNRCKDAKNYAEKSIQLFPNATSYINLGVSYFCLSDYKQAKESFTKALGYGDYYSTYEHLANLALVYGNPKENINFIKNVSLKKYPQDTKLWLDLAVIEYKNKEIDNAKSDISQAYSQDQSTQITSVYNVIMNNQPLELDFTFGK